MSFIFGLNLRWGVNMNEIKKINNDRSMIKTIYTSMIVLVFSLVTIFVAFMLVTKNIITPIKKLEKAMILVGQGDLSVRTNIQTSDEIEILGSFFNKMLSEQEQIVSKELVYTSEEMSSSSEEISCASTEITSSIQVVAEGA